MLRALANFGAGEGLPPSAQVDRLGNDVIGAHAVRGAKHLGRVPARGDYQVRPPHVQRLVFGLNRKHTFDDAGFIANLVGNDPFDCGHVATPFAPGNAVPVQIESHAGVARTQPAEPQPLVEEDSLRRIHGQVNRGRDDLNGVSQLFQRAAERLNANESSAAMNVQRR